MSHLDRANEILEVIRGIAATIPGYQGRVTAEDMRKLVRRATVPRAFIEQTAVAVEATQELASASRFDPDDARDGEAFADACDIVADELELIARGIRYAGFSRRASIGAHALQTLAIAKSLNRQAMVVPHVEAMQVALGTRKPRRPPPP